MSGKRHKKELWLDPRAKLFLILMCVLSSMFAPSLAYQFILVILIASIGGISFGSGNMSLRLYAFMQSSVPDSLDHGRNDRHAADNVYCLFRLVS